MKHTTLCYIEKDGKYLMLHRVKKRHDVNHDKWIGIGGHIESNETADECILREVMEEIECFKSKERERTHGIRR